MKKLLIFLMFPEPIRMAVVRRLEALFPGDLQIATVATREDANRAIADADILMTFGAHMREEQWRAAKRLKWVQGMGTGTDGITDAPALPKGVLVTAVHGLSGIPVSEAAIAFMLTLSRDFPRTVRNQANALWERWPSRLLHDKTVGILGVGAIAEHLAPRLKPFGMTVIGISRTPRAVAGFGRMVSREHLRETVPALDYLVLLAPLEPATRGIVGAGVLAAMKPTAYLINLARGGVVDEAALIETLQARRIAGAALDTFQSEPLSPQSPLWHTPNTIVTPHMGGFCDVYFDHAMPQVETNMRAFLAGTPDKMINRAERAS